MLHRLRNIRRDTRGVAAIEFALLLPILVTLLIGCLEVTFKIWSTQKAEKLAVTLADVVAQAQEVKISDLNALVGAVDKIMDPFPFGDDEGIVFISSVYVPQAEEGEDPSDPILNWQFSDGDLSATSKLGSTVNAPATLPDDFELAERDNVIVAEVFYKYTPMAPGLMFDEVVIYRRAFFKPRLGALTDPPS